MPGPLTIAEIVGTGGAVAAVADDRVPMSKVRKANRRTFNRIGES
jgi:hypothetical protein